MATIVRKPQAPCNASLLCTCACKSSNQKLYKLLFLLVDSCMGTPMRSMTTSNGSVVFIHSLHKSMWDKDLVLGNRVVTMIMNG